jgi:dihydroflavonol-4-reductase
MRVFITGGNGFIGSRVVRQLIGAGHQPRCLVRKGSSAKRLDGLAYEHVEGDVRDQACLVRGLAGCTAAIHLASVSAWNDIVSPLMRQVVVEGTANLLAAMRESAVTRAVTRAVYVSSATAINGSSSAQLHSEESPFTLSGAAFAYALAKREAEGLCRAAGAAGIAVVTVNPAEVYGPDDDQLITAGNLIDLLRSRPVLVCSGGTSIVHVDDVARGIVLALERGQGGSRYILGGENLTIRQLAELTLELAGRSGRIITLPNGLIRALARISPALHLPLPFNPALIPYATRYWFMDAGKAVRELGASFRPGRAVLEPTISWLRASGRLG